MTKRTAQMIDLLNEANGRRRELTLGVQALREVVFAYPGGLLPAIQGVIANISGAL